MQSITSGFSFTVCKNAKFAPVLQILVIKVWILYLFIKYSV